ncbi:MAG: PTS sugar transporter subunit IIA [Brevinema sp.]
MRKLVSVLSKLNSISIVDSVDTWQHSVYLCFKPLLDQQFITEHYINAAIKYGETLSFFYLITSGLAMPHARPEDGVLKHGFSMLIIKNGINFGLSHRYNPVYCVVGLAATSSSSHIKDMMDISEIFSSEQMLPTLIQKNNVDDIISCLNN